MSGSLRVIRHDTGQEVEIPADSLRWGPDCGQSSLRAALCYPSNNPAQTPLVPYFLPFPGAKFAVRVTLSPAPVGTAEPGFYDRWFRAKSVLAAWSAGVALLSIDRRTDGDVALRYASEDGAGGIFVSSGLEAEWIWGGAFPAVPRRARVPIYAPDSAVARDRAFADHAFRGTSAECRERLRDLLDAAADALRSEAAAGQRRLLTRADVATVQRAAAWLCTSNSPEAREIGGAMEALADRLTEAHWRGDV